MSGNEPKLTEYPKVQKPLNLLKETFDDDLTFLQESEDPVAHKSADSAFFGYKTHLAMVPERIVTGTTITTGKKRTGKNCQRWWRKRKALVSKWKKLVAMQLTRQITIFHMPERII